MQFLRYASASGQTDRQTDRQADMLIAIHHRKVFC